MRFYRAFSRSLHILQTPYAGFRSGNDHVGMSRRHFALLAVVLVALNVFFWVAQSGFALPQALIDRFFGPRMVRAEVIVQSPRGIVRDYRIDRGLITAVAPDAITLRERDGTLVTIQVAANARIVGLGRPANASQLRPNLRVLVFREANRPATMIQVERKGQ